MSMTAVANTGSDTLIAPPNFLERAENRIFSEFSADAEDWAANAGHLRQYPWTHFVENPQAEDLRKHKNTLKLMIAFGELLNLTTSSPVFPDKQIASLVTATLQMLRDDLTMWHGNDLTDAQAEELMQKCFPE
jgi:hypothetical protein